MNHAPANKHQNDIRTLSDAGRPRRQIAENRQKLQSVVNTLMTCARQNLALEDTGTSGRGGGVTAATEPSRDSTCWRLCYRGSLRPPDYTVRKSGNSKWIAWYAAEQLVKESVLKDVKLATVWSVIVNETDDRNKQEVVLLVLRYIGTAAWQRMGNWRISSTVV